MKRIINGRKYDTETAKEIGSWSTDLPVNDFGYEEETLYRKRNGEFFLHGSGGAQSSYAKQSYGSWTGGDDIKPLSREQAMKWAESHVGVDEYEAAFGEVGEDGELAGRISASNRLHSTVEALNEAYRGSGVHFSTWDDGQVRIELDRFRLRSPEDAIGYADTLTRAAMDLARLGKVDE